RELYGPGVFALRLRGDAHRSRRVHHEIDRQPLGGFVFLQKNLSRARGDTPVNRLDGIAGLVEARLDVFDATAEKWRSVRAEAEAVGQALDLQRELPLVEMIGYC